jgi:SH3-like domain-containing protein
MYYKVFSRNLIFYIGFMAIMFPMVAACGTLENGGMAPTETAIPTLQITPVDRYFEVVSDNVSSRQGPGLLYEAGDTFNKGDVVSISAVTASGEWYQLTEGDWIAADFVVPYDSLATQTSLPTNTPLPTPSPTVGTEQQPFCEIVVGSANLRAEPGREFAVISPLQEGDTLPIRAKTTGADGSVWYSVHLENGTAGWVIRVVCASIDDSMVPDEPFTPQSPPTAAPPTQATPTLIPPASPTPTPCVNRNCEPLEPIRTITPTRCIQRNCG